MQLKSIQLIQHDSLEINFESVYKNQFGTWNLKESVVLTPDQIDSIPLMRITKFKIYNEQPVEGHYLVKIEQSKEGIFNDGNKQQKNEAVVHLYAVGKQTHRIFFEKLMIFKFVNMGLEFNPSETFQNSIEEDIMKKSEFLKKWEQRHVKITEQEGLTSKKLEKEKESLSIKQTKEIWTRFQLLQNSTFVVIKMKYLLGKEEFAIPTRACGKWIRAMYTLFALE